MHEFENKEVAKWGSCKWMRREGIVDCVYGIGMSRGEFQKGNGWRGFGASHGVLWVNESGG